MPPLGPRFQHVRSLVSRNPRWRFTLTLTLAAGFIAGAASGILKPRHVAAQGAAAKVADPVEPVALYENLHKMGHRALDLIEQSVRVNAPVAGAPARVTAWSNTLLSCDLYRITSKSGHVTAEPEVYFQTARGPADPIVVKALREHFDRMKMWEERFRPLAVDRQILALDFMELQGRRLQAEIWLSRELHKPAGP